MPCNWGCAQIALQDLKQARKPWLAFSDCTQIRGSKKRETRGDLDKLQCSLCSSLNLSPLTVFVQNDAGGLILLCADEPREFNVNLQFENLINDSYMKINKQLIPNHILYCLIVGNTHSWKVSWYLSLQISIQCPQGVGHRVWGGFPCKNCLKIKLVQVCRNFCPFLRGLAG